MRYQGSCHCRAVTFELEAPDELEVEQCNCSICSKAGFLHLIIPRSCFKLLSGAEMLAEYTFNTGVAKHLFCRICGIKAFYIPRSNPDGVDVNTQALSIKISAFDGQNWEQHAAALAHKSIAS